MSKKRLHMRLTIMAMFALLLGPLAAPSMASAHQVSCDQNSECGCCIVICCQSDCHLDEHDEDELEPNEDAEVDEGVEDEADENNEDQSGEDESPTGNPADLIRFSELLPNPIGADTAGEFIELANLGSSAAEMSGWLIRSSSGKEFALPVGSLAAASQLALPFSETKITLTNGGLTLELVGPDGSVQDVVSYDDSVEGQALAKSGDSWLLTTTPTPGFGNVITVEQTETDTEEPTDTPVQPEVIINELLANPVGDDATGEWVELYNSSGVPADLTGWTLDDAEGGSNPYAFPADTTLAGGDYLVLERPTTKLALNNGADAVRLFAADGTLADEVAYDGATEGEALARTADDGAWATTASPTPGAVNAHPLPSDDEAEDENAANDSTDTDDGDSADNNDEPPTLTVEQVHDLPNDSLVRVTGVVTMPLGVVGSTIFGIRDTDAEYGATVRIYSSDRPDLQPGDVVVVDGKVTRKESGELRINTSGSHPVAIVGSIDQVDAPEVRLQELDGTGAGLAVTVTGQVTAVGSGWFVITDEQAEREIKVELPTGSLMPVESGDTVSVSGIVRVQRSVVALTVLDDGDVEAEDAPVSTDDPEEAAQQAAAEENGASTATLPFLVVGALGAGGVAYRGFRNKNTGKKS